MQGDEVAWDEAGALGFGVPGLVESIFVHGLDDLHDVILLEFELLLLNGDIISEW